MDRRTFLATAAAAATVGGRSQAADQPGGIIDAHTHFYDPSRPEGVPWPSPDDATLFKTVLPADWDGVARVHGATGTIVVEASPWVEDNQWLLDLADEERSVARRSILGVVGNLPLGDPGCRDLIARFARHPLYRGVRVAGDRLHAGLDDTGFVADLARLTDAGLAVDVNHGAVFAAADRLAARFPSLSIVIDHLGNPRFGDDGPEADWLDAIRRVARHPRITMKVSALAEGRVHAAAGRGRKGLLTTAFFRPWLDHAWDAFGTERLMFASNWPVSDLGCPWGQVLGLVQPYVAGLGAAVEARFYAGTAREAYGLA